MKTTVEIGDRFESNIDTIWECVSDEDFKCIYCPCNVYGIGRISNWGTFPIQAQWTYLGNFSKNNNFEELYNLLNE